MFSICTRSSFLSCLFYYFTLPSASVNIFLNCVVSWKDLIHGSNTSGFFSNIVRATYAGIALNPKIDIRKTGIYSLLFWSFKLYFSYLKTFFVCGELLHVFLIGAQTVDKVDAIAKDVCLAFHRLFPGNSTLGWHLFSFHILKIFFPPPCPDFHHFQCQSYSFKQEMIFLVGFSGFLSLDFSSPITLLG